MKVDHATGLCGGMVVSKRLNSPCWASLARLGSEDQCCSKKLGSMPSMPKTMTFLPEATTEWRAQPDSASSPVTSASLRREFVLPSMPVFPLRTIAAPWAPYLQCPDFPDLSCG